MKPRDLHRYTFQTNKRLLIGLILLLLIIGNGLIYIFYGQGAAIFGIFCMAALLLPLGLIWVYLHGLAWLKQRFNPTK
jgi:hypothetical protein